MTTSIDSVIASAGYSYPSASYLSNEFKAITARYPSLRVLILSYMGRPLLSLEGTLPITYKGSRYNIPVRFIYPDGYPSYPLSAQVVPTSGMGIKVSEYVDSKGSVNSQYLAYWRSSYGTATLAEEMIQKFSASPPVYSKASQEAPKPVVRPPAVPEQAVEETVALVQSYFDETTKQLDKEISTLKEEEKTLKERARTLDTKPTRVTST